MVNVKSGCRDGSLSLLWVPDGSNFKFFNAIKRNLYTDKLDVNQLKVN